MLEGALKGIVAYLLGKWPPERIEVMIDNTYLPIASAHHHAYCLEYEKANLSKNDIKIIEEMRNGNYLSGTLIPYLEQARAWLRYIPYQTVADKVTPQWMIEKGLEKCPEITKVIQKKGKKGEEWVALATVEMILYITGRYHWDRKRNEMVRVG